MLACGLIPSLGEGRRLIQQGGVRIDDEKVNDVNFSVALPESSEFIIQKGKKVFHRVRVI